jgi:hypothetical protein
MVDSLDAAAVDERLKPILRLARKLTERPASVADADAQAVCFNFMNRLPEGHRVHGHEKPFKQRGPMLKEHGYLPLIRLLQPPGKASGGTAE